MELPIQLLREAKRGFHEEWRARKVTDLPDNNLVFDESTSQTKVSLTLSLHLTPRGALRGSTVTGKEDMGKGWSWIL